jgi:hypothetical protein
MKVEERIETTKETNDLFNEPFMDLSVENMVKEDKPEKVGKKQIKSKMKSSAPTRHVFRRCYSEHKLFNVMPKTIKDGDCIHILSGGDIDALSFLIWVLRKQKIKHLIFSTWVMSKTDAEMIIDYQTKGDIEEIDGYVGEIFKSKNLRVFEYLKENLKGDLSVFRNHSKVFAGNGELFDFAITSSANINTNPRVENTNIFIGTDVMKFYKDFYKDINSFK